MSMTKVRQFLDDNHVEYTVIGHSVAFTALETASAAHLTGQELAKTVMVKVDGRMAMAVVPASYQVDLEDLRQGVQAETADLATEAEFRDLFPDCELGAMPPFGNLYGLPVYVAEKLTEDVEIAFNAGSHSELFQMRYEDFARLVRPMVCRFAARMPSPQAGNAAAGRHYYHAR